MSRKLCDFDIQMLCCNNYRGEDYNKPDTWVDCENCVDNPDNKHKLVDPEDPDKVFQSEEKAKYEKTLQKGINLLKNNPNATEEIIRVATRLSYLRGRLFEQKDKEELQQAYNIALEVNNELRAKLGIKLEKDGLINPGSELK